MKNPFKDPIYAASKPKRSKKVIIAIAIPIILFWGLILALIISSAVKNAPSPVMKIDMGDSTSQVERILGKPDEKNNYVWQYYGGEYKKLHNKQEKLLQKLETADEDEYEKIFEEVSEISDKLDTLEYSFTAITFDGDMKVNTIIHNSKVSKTATQGKSIESYELFPKYVSALSDPNFVKFTAKEEYWDKSYYYGPVNPDRSKIDTFKSGSCSVSWRSYFGNTKGTDCSSSISISETIEAGTTISGIVGRNVFTAKIENECTLDNLKLDITITNDYYSLSYDSENDKNWAKLRPYISSVTISNGITSIGSEVFKDCTSMTKVTIPESVTTIDEKAFEGCSAITIVNWNAKFFTPDKNAERSIFADCKDLTHFNIGENVTNIPAYLLSGCSKLTSITIPDSVKSIGERAFSGCSSLTSITIPDSVTTIGENAFSGCSALTEVNWNATACTVAGSSDYPVFKYCDKLTTINIGNNVTTIPNCAFYGCSALTNIIVGEENSAYASQDGILYNKSKTGFIHIPKAIKGAIVIPNGVTKIAYEEFKNCSSLTSIIIPDSVTSIDSNAFYDCSSLISIIVSEANTAYASQDGILYNKSKTEFVYIPYSIKGSIAIPDGVTTIDSGAFAYCSSLTSITIPDSVTSISYDAFYGCTSLTSITVKSGNAKYHSDGNCLIETASKTLVAGCNNSVIPADGSVTSIGYKAFYGCSALTSITIPDSVTSIGREAFAYCSSLASIIVDEANTAYASQDGILYNKTKTGFIHIPKAIKGAIVIPNGVTKIAYEEFKNCSSLTSIIIPDSVTSIGVRAFSGCSALTSITIPDSVTSISYNAFDGCLEVIQKENGINYVDKWVIDCDYGITQVQLRTNTKGIGAGAFEFHSITSITIPSSVTSIGEYAFRECDELTSITFNGTKAQWKSIEKDTRWNYYTFNYTVQCTDGKLDKYGEIE